MPRRPRIEFPGAFYHVIARGNKREDIFLEPAGKKRLLRKLVEYKARYKFSIYAYVFMNNHIHLLIETDEVPLSRIMQGVLQSHTQWHNKRYKSVGHLFQGRFKGILCDKDAYLIALVCYIHVNPVRAGLVEDPASFLWSSHRAYLGMEKSNVVDVEFVLGQLSKKRSEAVRLYENLINEYMSRGKTDEFYEVRDQRILGSEGFFDDVMQKANSKAGHLDGILSNKGLGDVANAIKLLTGVTVAELKSRKRESRIMRARALFIKLALIFADANRTDIADFLGRGATALSYIEKKISSEEVWASIGKLGW